MKQTDQHDEDDRREVEGTRPKTDRRHQPLDRTDQGKDHPVQKILESTERVVRPGLHPGENHPGEHTKEENVEYEIDESYEHLTAVSGRGTSRRRRRGHRR